MNAGALIDGGLQESQHHVAASQVGPPLPLQRLYGGLQSCVGTCVMAWHALLPPSAITQLLVLDAPVTVTCRETENWLYSNSIEAGILLGVLYYAVYPAQHIQTHGRQQCHNIHFW